jgi:hypothetical protein
MPPLPSRPRRVAINDEIPGRPLIIGRPAVKNRVTRTRRRRCAGRRPSP